MTLIELMIALAAVWIAIAGAVAIWKKRDRQTSDDSDGAGDS